MVLSFLSVLFLPVHFAGNTHVSRYNFKDYPTEDSNLLFIKFISCLPHSKNFRPGAVLICVLFFGGAEVSGADSCYKYYRYIK